MAYCGSASFLFMFEVRSSACFLSDLIYYFKANASPTNFLKMHLAKHRISVAGAALAAEEYCLSPPLLLLFPFTWLDVSLYTKMGPLMYRTGRETVWSSANFPSTDIKIAQKDFRRFSLKMDRNRPRFCCDEICVGDEPVSKYGDGWLA